MEAPPCVLIRKVKVLPHMLEPKNSKNGRFKHPRQAGFGGRYFFEILVSPLAFNCQSVGALFLSAQKCGSSCFKLQKVWELLL